MLMTDWIVPNRDYIFFIIAVLVCVVIQEICMRRYIIQLAKKLQQNIASLPLLRWSGIVVYGLIATTLIVGGFAVNHATTMESMRMESILAGTARILSYELMEQGHASLPIDVDSDDPLYIAVVNTIEHWLQINPSIQSIYTMRKRSDGSNVFLVDGAVDYNGNGKIDEDIEGRTPPGTVYKLFIKEMEQAFNGKEGLEKAPTTDQWGTSISYYVPIYTKEGQQEGIVGLDYDGTQWLQVIRSSRQKMVIFFVIILFLLDIIYGVIILVTIDGEKNKYHRQEIWYKAYYDDLTGLPNRSLLNQKLTEALEKAAKSGERVGVLLFDLDRFKVINDSIGHRIGDRLLQNVAQRLQLCIKDQVLLCHFGGDAFVVMFGQVNQEDRIRSAAEEIMKALRPSFWIDEHELFITASIGISIFPQDGDNAQTLLKNAETAVYSAKENGRDTVEYYKMSMNEKSLMRLQLENKLRSALEKKEFIVYYQPQIDCKTAEIVSAEALIRWQDPIEGLISPGEFIPLAEETGLIVPMGEWMLYAVCEQINQWQRQGYPPIRIDVNLSARQFRQHDIVNTIKQVLHDTGVYASSLGVEITESIAMKNEELTYTTLKQLEEMGVHISIDDFGTGYSSLSYLKKYPLHTLKIDQSFVRDLVVDSSDAAIASAIILMAHGLHLEVVAEGVETLEQIEFLRENQCDRLQGFIFSRPVPPEEFQRLLPRQKEIS